MSEGVGKLSSYVVETGIFTSELFISRQEYSMRDWLQISCYLLNLAYLSTRYQCYIILF